MNIVLFGAPGSGKGTQAILLSSHFGLKRVSLGDILRQEVEKNSDVGQKVRQYMQRGVLVPDELVAKLIEDHLDSQGFILDGYPRNLSQAEALEEILNRHNSHLDAFIYLEVDRQIVIERLGKRRVCKVCGENYHLVNMPPRKEGICDNCGGKLIQRTDDTPDVIAKRWEVFLEESQQLLNFYQRQNKLLKIDGNVDKETVFEEIKDKLS